MVHRGMLRGAGGTGRASRESSGVRREAGALQGPGAAHAKALHLGSTEGRSSGAQHRAHPTRPWVRALKATGISTVPLPRPPPASTEPAVCRPRGGHYLLCEALDLRVPRAGPCCQRQDLLLNTSEEHLCLRGLCPLLGWGAQTACQRTCHSVMCHSVMCHSVICQQLTRVRKKLGRGASRCLGGRGALGREVRGSFLGQGQSLGSLGQPCLPAPTQHCAFPKGD